VPYRAGSSKYSIYDPKPKQEHRTIIMWRFERHMCPQMSREVTGDIAPCLNSRIIYQLVEIVINKPIAERRKEE
jgi:hypothetical protein